MLGGAGVVFFPRYLYLPTVSKSSLGSGVSAYNDFRWRYGCDLQVSESFEIVPVPPSSIPAAPERPRSTRCRDRGSLPIIANLGPFHCSLGYNRIIFTYR